MTFSRVFRRASKLASKMNIYNTEQHRRNCFKVLDLLGVVLIVANFISVHCVNYDGGSAGSGWLNDSIVFQEPSDSSKANVDNKSVLYFLVMAPYPDSDPFKPSWDGGPAVVPGAVVAKDLINTREDILEDYTIHFLVSDSGCNIASKAINNFFYGLFYSDKNIVGIVGPGCSEATIAIASLITDDQLSLLQIVPSATSPNLTDTRLFPNTFRPIVSALGVVGMYIELIKREKYRRVGALYEAQRPFHTTVYSHFEAALEEAGIQLTSFGLSDVQNPVVEFRFKVRIIFVFASPDLVRNLLCSALYHNMLYQDYQFIFSDKRPTNLLRDTSFYAEGKQYSCSANEMKQTVVGMVFNDFRLARHDRVDTTDAGISFNDFHMQYDEALSFHLESLGLDETIETEYESNYFDATWALALSLNNSIPRLSERQLSLLNYTYGMPEITNIVREELLNLSFEGMRGRVEFSEKTNDGANVTVIDMYQILHRDVGIVGFYDPTMVEPLVLYANATLIQGHFELEYIMPSAHLGIIVTLAVVVLLVTLFVCQVATFVWGKHKIVKAASPNLNHLIFSGCYLALVGVLLYTNAFVFMGVAKNSNIVIPVHCSALQWTVTMTYSLVFGTLCAKRWRIYRIFKGFSAMPMKLLSDKVLISMALIPLAIDVVVNTLWNIVAPWYFSTKRGTGLLAEATCHTNNDVAWAVCITVPKGALTAVVFYLAIATRRIHRKEFRQTKSINSLIYCLTIVTVVSLSLYFILLQLMVSVWTISISYLCFCLFDLTFVVLCIVFVLLPPLLTPIKEKLLKTTHGQNYSSTRPNFILHRSRQKAIRRRHY